MSSIAVRGTALPMRVLSSSDVAPMPLDVVAEIVRTALFGVASGSIKTQPRLVIDSSLGSRFMAFPAVLETEGVAGVKWLSAPGPEAHGKGNRIDAVILLNTTDTGEVVAVVDGRWITAARTAAMSLVAARALARPDSRRLAFLACGEQASLHLEALGNHFPIREVAAWSRRLATAEAFAAEATARGYLATAHADPGRCVEGADIVIASVPAMPETLVDAAELTSECFVSLVDLGRSILPETVAVDSILAIDDVDQFVSLRDAGRVAAFEQLKPSALCDLVMKGSDPRALQGRQRVFLPTGLGAADILIASRLIASLSKRSSRVLHD